MHATVLMVHGAIGALALLSYWIAAFARKGSPLHRAAGRVYLATMAAILLTAVPLSLAFFGRGEPVFGAFFLYLLVLVGTSVVLAPRAVRLKRDFAAYRDGIYPWLAWLQLGAGVLAAALGLWARQPLLPVFAAVGVVRSLLMLRLRRNAPPAGWWLREHFTAMIGNGVATHVAFLNIGLQRLLPAPLGTLLRDSHLAWFGPLALAIAAGAWLNIRHRRRFGGRGRNAGMAPPLPAQGAAAGRGPV